MITKEYLQQELAKRIDGYKRGVATTTDNIIAEMKSILVLVDALNDYEKKYKEALERAKAYHRNELAGTRQEMTEYIFPELRESEDEEIRQQLLWLCGQWEHNPEGRTIPADIDNIRKIRNWLEKQKESLHISESCKENADSFTSEEERIRKALIDALKVSETIGELKFRLPYPTREECIAYLEKQKEQKPNYCHHEVDETGWTEEYRKAYYDGWNNCNMQHEQLKSDRNLETFHTPYNPDEYEVVMEGNATILRRKDQNPIEKRDYYGLNDLERAILRGFLCAGVKNVPVGIIKDTASECMGFLALIEPKPAEWSEEDEVLRQDCIQFIETGWTDNGKSHLIPWLKSLRPQPHWKPSVEQMEALMLAIEGKCPPTSYMSRRLEDLYDGLANTYRIDAKLD